MLIFKLGHLSQEINTVFSFLRDATRSLLKSKGTILNSYFGPINRVAKFCDRVGDSARALRIAAIKKA